MNTFEIKLSRKLFDRVQLATGDVAQMVERSLCMREVQGSIPCISTLKLKVTFFIFGEGLK